MIKLTQFFFFLLIGGFFCSTIAEEGEGTDQSEIVEKRFLRKRIVFKTTKNEDLLKKLKLSPDEKQVIEANPILEVVVRVEQAPFSMMNNLKPKGYFIDVLERMVKGTGIRLTYEPKEGWEEPTSSEPAEHKYKVVVSAMQDDSRSIRLIAGVDIALDTIITNKRKGGLRFIRQLTKMSEVNPRADQFLLRSKEYDFSKTNTSVSMAEDAVRRVSSSVSNYTILNYERAQYFLKEDRVNSLDLIRISSLHPDFKPIKNKIGLAIDHNSPIYQLLTKLYKSIPASDINKLKRKWLTNYQRQDTEGKLPLGLDVHELNFLSKNKVLTYVTYHNDYPFEAVSKSDSEDEAIEPIGFVKNMLDIFSEATGVEIKYVRSSAISDIEKLNTLKSKKAHFFKSDKSNKNNQVLFETDFFFSFKNHYITRYDSPRVKTLVDLKDKKVAGKGNHAIPRYINNPSFEFIRASDYRRMLEELSVGDLDVVIAPPWVLDAPYISEGLHNLKVNDWAKEFDLENHRSVAFRVSRETPELVTILNKFITVLKAKYHLGLKDTWMGTNFGNIKTLLQVQNKSLDDITRGIYQVNNLLKLPKFKGLSNEEVGYLKSIKRLDIGVNSNWSPFAFDRKGGGPQGLAVDYINRIRDNLNLNIKITSSQTTQESLNKLDRDEIKILATAVQAGEIMDKYQFTSPYGVYPFLYACKKSTGKVEERQLNGKKVGVVGGRNFLDFLIKAYPKIDFIKMPSVNEGFKRVNNGRLFAYLDIGPMIKYKIRKKDFPGVILSGTCSAKAPMAFALKDDAPPQLISIINKVLSKISNFDRNNFEEKWFSVKVQVETVIDYTTVFLVVGFTVILTIFFVYWNSKLTRLNQVIKEKESLSRSLLESTNAVPYNFDLLKGDFTYLAPQITKMLGFIPNDFEHYEEWGLLIHPDDREAVFDRRNKGIKSGEKYLTLEYRIKNRNKEYIWVKDMVTVLYDKGYAVALHGLLLDITNERNQTMAIKAAKDAAESANRSKSQFLANMSHEIRTPLNPIIGLAHLALTSDPSLDQVKDYMGKIQTSSKSLLRIINDILDLSKMEAEKLNLEEIPFDLTQLNERISSLYGVKAAEKNIQLKFKHDLDVHPYVVGDPLRLEQVIGNLVSNAIKFTDEGSVSLVIESIENKDNEETLCFKIIDTGLGIPEDKLSKIFEVFTQADDSNTRTHGGTGLGLSICKKLITLMGGHLDARSEEGIGSTFYFKLTLKTVPKEDYVDHNQTMFEKNTIPQFVKTKILLAEDNMINKQVAEELLKAVNLDISHVRNGKECVAAVKAGDYELVLMDIQMPVMDGFEATKRIRADKRFDDLPIIAMTAQAFASEKKQSKAVGMNEHVTKPIDPKELYEALAKFIKIEEVSKGAVSHVETQTKKQTISESVLDIQAGIKRLVGNESLYRNIVLDFKGQYQNIDKELTDDLKANQIQQVKSKLHQLKGAAGNLGATELFLSVKDFEACLKSEKPYEEAHLKFNKSLKATFEVIDQWAGQGEASAEKDSEENVVSQDALDKLFDQLVVEIEQASPNAMNTIEELEQVVADEQKDFIVKVKEHLNNFDFSKASKEIERYAEIQSSMS